MAITLEQPQPLLLANNLRATLNDRLSCTPLHERMNPSVKDSRLVGLWYLAIGRLLGYRLIVPIKLETMPDFDIEARVYSNGIKIVSHSLKDASDGFSLIINLDGQITKRRPKISKIPPEFIQVGNGGYTEIKIGQDETVTPEDLQLIENVTTHLQATTPRRKLH